VHTNSASPTDDTGVRHEDSHRDNGSSHYKPVQMWVGTSELNGFPTPVTEDDNQEKNAAEEDHSTHNDLPEVLKGSCVLFLVMGVQANALTLVLVFALRTHPVKLSLAWSTGEIRPYRNFASFVRQNRRKESANLC